LLQGYAPPNKDRREGVLTRKRLEYVECVSQYYDIPDSERSDEEITMLRQVTFLAYDLLTHSINLFSQNQSSYSHLLACRLQSIAQELYLMLPFSRILKFKNLLSAFYIHGKL